MRARVEKVDVLGLNTSNILGPEFWYHKKNGNVNITRVDGEEVNPKKFANTDARLNLTLILILNQAGTTELSPRIIGP